MTYDRMSTYLTWGGRIGTDVGTREVWQCGVHLTLDPSLDGPGLPTPAELDTLFSGVLSTFHSSGGLALAQGAVLEWAKAASLDTTGHETASPVVTTTAVSSVGGSVVAATTASPQDSLVLTFYSGSTFGRANYGRIYLPWWSSSVAHASGRATTGSAIIVAETWFDGVNAWAATALSASAKIRIMSKLGAGTTKEVAFLKIGDVKDTQRRRRNRISESYDVVAV